MTPPETDRRTLDVTAAVEARLSMGETGQRIQERDAKAHTGGSDWIARMQRKIEGERPLAYSTWMGQA